MAVIADGGGVGSLVAEQPGSPSLQCEEPGSPPVFIGGLHISISVGERPGSWLVHTLRMVMKQRPQVLMR